MLIAFLALFFLLHLIKFLISRKKNIPRYLKLKDLKNHILETDLLTLKSILAKQIIIFIKIVALGLIIQHWGFSLLGLLAKHPKINPLAHYLYNQFTRTQIFDCGHFILWYGYVAYLIFKIYRWAKATLKTAKKETKIKEKAHETK